MTDTAASLDHANYPLRVRDFYLGRQPVLDRNQALYGYELLFRSARQGEADETGLTATAAVIAHAAQLGLARARPSWAAWAITAAVADRPVSSASPWRALRNRSS